MADPRYDLILATVRIGVGQRTTAEFNRLFSSSNSATTSDIWDAYLWASIRMLAAAHPDVWPWQKDKQTLDADDNVVNSTDLTASPFSAIDQPTDTGVYLAEVRREDVGSWQPLDIITKEEAESEGRNNITTALGVAISLGTGEHPRYASVYREAPSTFVLYIWDYTIVAADNLGLAISYRKAIPKINGASTPDSSMIHPQRQDLAVAYLGRMHIAAQLRMWEVFDAAYAFAMMEIRAELREQSIGSVAGEFIRLVEAMQEHRNP